jgi:hypothetical protein
MFLLYERIYYIFQKLKPSEYKHTREMLTFVLPVSKVTQKLDDRMKEAQMILVNHIQD